MGIGKVNENKFCFIICTNNEIYLQECIFYIKNLNIPEGYTIEIISIPDAKSMASGYNEGMRASDAKYKIYLHQDVFIVYKYFLKSVIEIFKDDYNIGMIGMVGPIKMPVNGIMWYADRIGDLYNHHIYNQKELNNYVYNITDGWEQVEAIDGLLMITSVDIPWREDLFKGFHYYDVSQSMEFMRNGYKVIVPYQKVPWAYHDGKIVNYIDYNKYRKIGMEEYKEYFYPERFTFKVSEKKGINRYNTKIVIIATNQYEEVMATLYSILKDSEIKENDIIIVDNGSEDKLRHWIKNQKIYSYMICGEIIEKYGVLLKEIIRVFIQDENILLLSPGIEISSNVFRIKKSILDKNDRCGVISAGITYHKNIIERQISEDELDINNSVNISPVALLLNNKLIKRIEILPFDLPENTLNDILLKSISENFVNYNITNELYYSSNSVNKEAVYLDKLGSENDKELLKKVWGSYRLKNKSNDLILEMFNLENIENINVLEIGCGCGGNLLLLKNTYPQINIYGVEQNINMLKVSEKITDVRKDVKSFDNNFFDYILFDNTLQYESDIHNILEVCKDIIKENGKIISVIPNIMYHEVLRNLLDGYCSKGEVRITEEGQKNIFTYYEIIKLFQRHKYNIEKILFKTKKQELSESENQYIDKLLQLSNNTEKYMFSAEEFVVFVKK